jgi:hypothetical protein
MRKVAAYAAVCVVLVAAGCSGEKKNSEEQKQETAKPQPKSLEQLIAATIDDAKETARDDWDGGSGGEPEKVVIAVGGKLHLLVRTDEAGWKLGSTMPLVTKAAPVVSFFRDGKSVSVVQAGDNTIAQKFLIEGEKLRKERLFKKPPVEKIRKVKSRGTVQPVRIENPEDIIHYEGEPEDIALDEDDILEGGVSDHRRWETPPPPPKR